MQTSTNQQSQQVSSSSTSQKHDTATYPRSNQSKQVQQQVIFEANQLLDKIVNETASAAVSLNSNQFCIEDVVEQRFYIVSMTEAGQLIFERDGEKVGELPLSQLEETLKNVDKTNQSKHESHRYFRQPIIKSALAGNLSSLQTILTAYFNDSLRKRTLWNFLGIQALPERLWYV